MIYRFTLTITLFAISFSLNSMEKPRKLLRRAASLNPFSNNKKSDNKTKFPSPNKTVKNLMLIENITTNPTIPLELTNAIKSLYLLVEEKELITKYKENKTLIQNLKKNNLEIPHLLILDNDQQENLLVKYLTSEPHHLTSTEKYKTFLKLSLGIRKLLYDQQPHILVQKPSTIAVELTLGIDPYSRYLGLTPASLFTKKEEKLLFK
jgi:hypothetical protein